MKITLISGSPRKQSVTVRVALFLERYFTEKGHDLSLIDLRELGLPFTEDPWQKEEEVPETRKALWKKMHDSDAMVFVSPEYNGGYSPALKLLIDHFPKQSYARKTIGIVTASPGAMGGMRAALQLQLLSCALWAAPCPHMLIVPAVDKKFDEEARLTDEGFGKSIDRFAEEFLWQATALHKAR